MQSIIEHRYLGFHTYQEYLKGNLEVLVRISNSVKNNFRHVVYALDSLHYCYSAIKNVILDPKHEIYEKVQEQLTNISTLTLALAVEYKASNIKPDDLNDFRDHHIIVDSLLFENDQQNGKAEEKTKPKYEVLIERYSINKNDYHLFQTIYNYVTGHEEFVINSFISEFKKKFNLEKGKVLPQYELLDSLSYHKCYDLSDDEYEEKTRTLIEYARNGRFDAVQYLPIMHYVERFDNAFNFNLDEVKTSLLQV